MHWLKTALRCVWCNKKIPPGSRFCPYCRRPQN
ncbi:zinc-ribbon domain-containing protein [Patescibacteria group bacterium]|nr:zinc-ribbon domain-containing protein [Patescibacteria group bacterium]MBU1966797.1 zinc-ribbon domain-containing protein [Patescibacteria group bacterium]